MSFTYIISFAWYVRLSSENTILYYIYHGNTVVFLCANNNAKENGKLNMRELYPNYLCKVNVSRI